MRFLDGEIPRKGFVVAYKETQHSYGKDGLRKCLLHAIDHDGIIGGWINEDGKLQFDSSQIIYDLDEAIEAGRKNDQVSIFYLNKGCEILM